MSAHVYTGGVDFSKYYPGGRQPPAIVNQPPTTPDGGVITDVAGWVWDGLKYVLRRAAPDITTSLVPGDVGPPVMEETIVVGQKPKRRRRRRQLLTCGDKADIAFLTGTLGKGAMGQAAVSAVLSRRCS